MFWSLITSAVLCFLSGSWLTLWVLLEINTLSFCTINCSDTSHNENIFLEISINYFMIQSIASAILIAFISLPSNSSANHFFFMGGIAALLINIGASPFHEWFIKMIKNINFNSATILITWQNLPPLYLSLITSNTILWAVVILTAVVGGTSPINNNKLLEILGYSSIFNLAWLLLALLTNINTFLAFLITYWISLFLIIITINNFVLQNSPNTSLNLSNPLLTVILVTSLGGMPPTLGFLGNFLVVYACLNIKIFLVILFVILITALNLYIYLRIVSPSLFNSIFNSQNTNLNISSNFVLSVSILTFLPLITIILLDYTWNSTILIEWQNNI